MHGDFLAIKKDLPVIGIGLGLRKELAEDTLNSSAMIDWLEFVPENYMELGGMAKQRLQAAGELFPLISHGINLSIGSTDDLNQSYLESLKEVLDRTNSPWWSDHLCFTSIDHTYLHDLLPLPFTREAVKHIAERIKRAQDFMQRPFLLENISFYMHMPCAEMSEAQFLSEVLEVADCGLLLDVNNIYVNSINHVFDPYDYLAQLPIERTVQVHVAGHKRIDDYVIDTHGAPVIEPVYQLLEHVLKKTKVHGVMLERDQNFPAFGEIIAEVELVRKIASRVQPELCLSRKAVAEISNFQTAKHIAPDHPVKGGRELRAISA